MTNDEQRHRLQDQKQQQQQHKDDDDSVRRAAAAVLHCERTAFTLVVQLDIGSVSESHSTRRICHASPVCVTLTLATVALSHWNYQLSAVAGHSHSVPLSLLEKHCPSCPLAVYKT